MNSRTATFIVAGTIALATPASAIDLNNNGMSDVWEMVFSVPSDAAADHYDGDGFTNAQESVLGTDPYDLLSRAHLEMIRDPAQNELRLRIDTSIGKLYEVQTSNDLAAWSTVGPTITGTGAAIDVITTLPDESVSRGFFRYLLTGEIDTDGDLLTAWEETSFGSRDDAANSDSDTLSDLDEFKLNLLGITLDPALEFTTPGVRDGDGDFDGDGVNDKDELAGGTNPASADSYPAGHPDLDLDFDSLKDAWETQHFGSSALQTAEGNPDGDRLSNVQEQRLNLIPTSGQSDGIRADGLSDQDGDNVIDVWELEDGTDPFNASSNDLAKNFVVLLGRMEHRSTWGAVGDVAQFNGTVMRATAVGFENAQLASSNRVYGVVNEVSGFVSSGANWQSEKYMRFRKGVEYRVEITTTSNNLPFVSGKYFWRSTGNSDEPSNKFYDYLVENRQWYAANSVGTPVAAAAVTPNPDVNDTHFTQKSSSQGGPDSVMNPTGKLFVGLPEIKDLKDVANTMDDAVVRPLIVQLPVTSQNGPPSTVEMRQRVEYWASVPDDSFAWIEAHKLDGTATADAPRMPQLQAQIPNLGAGYSVQWRFRCIYRRGNGYRAALTQSEDTIILPSTGFDTLPANQPWKLYEKPEWRSDMFGGDCELIYRVYDPGNNPVTNELIVRFFIGGRNPQSPKARTFVDTEADRINPALTTFAYAIAKEESPDYGGPGTRYNQFYARSLPSAYNIQKARDWRAWRPFWPVFMDDASGPGGYGIFQNTRPSIPRKEIWDWQKNVTGGIEEINDEKLPQVTEYLDQLDRTYPGAEPLPNVSYTFDAPGGGTITRTVSGLEATIMTAYNGFGGTQRRFLRYSDGKSRERLTCWTYDPTRSPGQRWQFHKNTNDYVRKVLNYFE